MIEAIILGWVGIALTMLFWWYVSKMMGHIEITNERAPPE